MSQPAGQRNLAVVLLQERVDLTLAKTIFTFLARALGHLHANGLIHGDFKVCVCVCWGVVTVSVRVACARVLAQSMFTHAILYQSPAHHPPSFHPPHRLSR